MKGYICNDCGAPFENPYIVKGGFYHAFGFKAQMEEHCPFCGGEDFEEADECPNCGLSLKRESSNLCPGCHMELLRKFKEFADGLTFDEEKDLDDMLDGNSITERETWK